MSTARTLAACLAIAAAGFLLAQVLTYTGHTYWQPRHACAHWYWC